MPQAEAEKVAGWQGGALPFAISSKKLGMWLFILSDALTFGVLLVCYSYLRLSTENWPRPFSFSPDILIAAVMTFCLLSNGLTVALAAAAPDARATIKWLLVTIASGLVFLILFGYEWQHLINAEQLKLMSNRWGVPLFGASFFLLTGLHMLHVVSGLIYLSVVTFNFRRGAASRDDLEVCALYWHFVDLVWVFIFPSVYLLSVKGNG